MKSKRVVAVFTAVLMLVMFSSFAVADTLLEFSVGDATSVFGETVSVPINLVCNIRTECVGCTVIYDPDVLTYDGFENTIGYGKNDYDVADVEPGVIEITVISVRNSYNSTWFTLNFTCTDDAPVSVVSINTDVSVEFLEGSCFDEDIMEIPEDDIMFEGGTVTISRNHEEPTFDLSVNGEAIEGHELSAEISNFSDDWGLEPSFEYSWISDGVVKGTEDTYTPGEDDVGCQLSLRVTATVDAPVNPSATVSFEIGEVAFDYSCGENLTWSFENGVLTITGYGGMYDYSEREIPWEELDVQTVYIDENVSGICPGVFEYCSNLSEITVNENSPYFAADDGNLISRDGKTFYQYAIGKYDRYYKIPASVETVEDYAFSSANYLESVIMYEDVEKIGKRALIDNAIEHIYFTGSQTKWDSIQKDNDDFSYIELHFNHNDEIILVDGKIEDVVYDEDEGEVTAEIDIDLIERDCSVLMAVYDEDETLIASAMAEAGTYDWHAEITCSVEESIDNCHVKVFFWDSLDGRIPVGKDLQSNI